MTETNTDVATGGLTMHTLTREDSTVVECTGRLIAENSTALKNHVKGLLPHTKRIVLDLKDVTRMDSAGLGAIVGLYVSARKEKCEFSLANYNQSIKDLLGITNLLSVFESCARAGTRFP